MLQSSINNNMTYTIILTQEQKELVCKAMDRFSQMHLGQTAKECEVAKKLTPLLHKAFKNATTDLTKE